MRPSIFVINSLSRIVNLIPLKKLFQTTQRNFGVGVVHSLRVLSFSYLVYSDGPESAPTVTNRREVRGTKNVRSSGFLIDGQKVQTRVALDIAVRFAPPSAIFIRRKIASEKRTTDALLSRYPSNPKNNYYP